MLGSVTPLRLWCANLGGGRNDLALKGVARPNTPATHSYHSAKSKRGPIVFIRPVASLGSPANPCLSEVIRRIQDFTKPGFRDSVSPDQVALTEVEPTTCPTHQVGALSSRPHALDNPLGGMKPPRTSRSQRTTSTTFFPSSRTTPSGGVVRLHG